jgi:hypothetical protein
MRGLLDFMMVLALLVPAVLPATVLARPPAARIGFLPDRL